jgi:hypothetical protein
VHAAWKIGREGSSDVLIPSYFHFAKCSSESSRADVLERALLIVCRVTVSHFLSVPGGRQYFDFLSGVESADAVDSRVCDSLFWMYMRSRILTTIL